VSSLNLGGVKGKPYWKDWKMLIGWGYETEEKSYLHAGGEAGLDGDWRGVYDWVCGVLLAGFGGAGRALRGWVCGGCAGGVGADAVVGGADEEQIVCGRACERARVGLCQKVQ
jgi:hypothetical protein